MYVYFIRNCQTVFQSGCVFLYSYQQYMTMPGVPSLILFQMWSYGLFLENYYVLQLYLGGHVDVPSFQSASNNQVS